MDSIKKSGIKKSCIKVLNLEPSDFTFWRWCSMMNMIKFVQCGKWNTKLSYLNETNSSLYMDKFIKVKLMHLLLGHVLMSTLQYAYKYLYTYLKTVNLSCTVYYGH